MFTFTQIILIMVFYLVYQSLSQLVFIVDYGNCVLLGFLTGLAMREPTEGLVIGGTMELMNIGLNPLGGSSVPNYKVGTVLGTAFSLATQQGLEVAIAIGIPAGTLYIQLDVFAKMIGTWIYHQAMKANDEMKFKQVYRWCDFGFVITLLMKAIPVLLILIAGSQVVEIVLSWLPTWFMNGMKVAGGILPALGFVVLLHSLPLKKSYMFLILCYVLYAYLNMPVLGVSLIGLVITLILFNQYQINDQLQLNGVTVLYNEGGVEGDE